MGGLLEREGGADHDAVDAAAGHVALAGPEGPAEDRPAARPRPAKGKARDQRHADVTPVKATVYPPGPLFDEAMRLGRNLGGKTKTDCLLLMIELGVETARRRVTKTDRLEQATAETHDIAVTTLAYVTELAAHLEMTVSKETIDEGKGIIINKLRRR